jgi:hypothetical protein
MSAGGSLTVTGSIGIAIYLTPKEKAMSNEQIEEWATASVAAMLERVRKVLIWEYEHLIEGLRDI